MSSRHIRWVRAGLCVAVSLFVVSALLCSPYDFGAEQVERRRLSAEGDPVWYLVQHQQGAHRYYTLSGGEGTPWAARFGKDARAWLFLRRGEGDILYLQRSDARVLRLHLKTGEVAEAPLPEEPLISAELFYQAIEPVAMPLP